MSRIFLPPGDWFWRYELGPFFWADDTLATSSVAARQPASAQKPVIASCRIIRAKLDTSRRRRLGKVGRLFIKALTAPLPAHRPVLFRPFRHSSFANKASGGPDSFSSGTRILVSCMRAGR